MAPVKQLFSMTPKYDDLSPAANEPDGHVDVVLVNELSEVHLGVGLGDADHRLDVTDGDGDAAGGHRLATEVAVHLGNLRKALTFVLNT